MMKKNYFKKMLILAIICLGLNQMSNAQCNASFTYTLTNSYINATSTSTGTLSTTEYNWTLYNASGANIGGFTSYGVLPPSFSVPYNGTYSLTLTISDSITCSNTTTQTITVSGEANAPACNSSFTYTVGSAGQVSFTNTSPTDPLANTGYAWYVDNSYIYGNSSTATSPTYTFYYNGTYTVALNVGNNLAGCSTSSSQTLAITNANTVPPCNSNFTYTVGAAGHVDFTSLYTGIPHGSTWSFGDGHYFSDSSNISNTYLYNGTYSVTLNVEDSAANCFSSTTQTISITNTATQPCVPSVTFNMHQDSLNPQPGVWLVSTYYSSQVTSAVWNWGDGTSTTGFAPAHTYTAAGNYHICVSVYSACGDSSTTCQNDSLFRMAHNSTNGTNSIISLTVLNVNATGIKTAGNETAQVIIYPNPSTGLFNLNINSTNATKAQINISNILGETVYSEQEQINNNTFSKVIDLQNLANGAYFVKAIVDNKTFSSKLIISK